MEDILMQKTNSELAIALAVDRKLMVTARQISKSRKRGYITTSDDGVKVRYTAPAPAFITTNPTGHHKKGK